MIVLVAFQMFPRQDLTCFVVPLKKRHYPTTLLLLGCRKNTEGEVGRNVAKVLQDQELSVRVYERS